MCSTSRECDLPRRGELGQECRLACHDQRSQLCQLKQHAYVFAHGDGRVREHSLDLDHNGLVCATSLHWCGIAKFGDCRPDVKHSRIAVQLRRYSKDQCRKIEHCWYRLLRVVRTAPVVSSSHAANLGLTASGIVTLSGLSFGGTNFTSTAALTISDACSSTAWTSSTTLACRGQAYTAGSSLCTTVTISGIAGTWSGRFSFDGTSAYHHERGLDGADI
jgi:hypothetical protein